VLERYQVDERDAFEMLRTHARRSGRKLVHVAQAVLDGHLLLTGRVSAPRDGDGFRAAAEAASGERRGVA
jgi:hypothetical protein